MAAQAVAVGGRVEVTQIGDVTVNERTDLLYVEDGESAALLEKKTTVAEVPQGDGTTAVVAGVEYRVRAAEQPNEQELDIPGTERIPDSRPRRPQPTTTTSTTTTSTATARRPPPAASTNRTPTDQHRTRQQPRPTQRRNNAGSIQTVFMVKRDNPWHKCRCYFYILWMFLLTCLGVVGLGFVGLGEFTRKCQKESDVGMFELWTSSFVTGAVMVSFSLCVWLSCGAYYICCRKQKALCIGVVTGCGIIAGFIFIIAFSFNVSAVGMTVDAVNATLHDRECLSPYWLAYMPPFASGAVFLVLLVSLCCCAFCNRCFYLFCDLSDNRYDRL